MDVLAVKTAGEDSRGALRSPKAPLYLEIQDLYRYRRPLDVRSRENTAHARELQKMRDERRPDSRLCRTMPFLTGKKHASRGLTLKRIDKEIKRHRSTKNAPRFAQKGGQAREPAFLRPSLLGEPFHIYAKKKKKRKFPAAEAWGKTMAN